MAQSNQPASQVFSESLDRTFYTFWNNSVSDIDIKLEVGNARDKLVGLGVNQIHQ